MRGDRQTLRLFGWDVGAFLRWWREGLVQCLPKRLRRLAEDMRPRLILDPQDDGLNLTWVEGGESQQLGLCESPSPSLPEESAIRRARSLVPPRLEKRDSALELRFPPDYAMHRALTMPLEAEQDLHKSVGYQIDRLTPFKLADVYYDVVVGERDRQRRQLRVNLFVLPRKLIDPWLRQLGEHWGARPDILSIAGVDGAVNLLPQTDRPEASGGGFRVNVILSILLLALLVTAIAFPLVQKWRVLNELENRLAEARPRATATLEQRDQVDRAGQALAFLQNQRMDPGRPLELTEQLSRITGDDTWLHFVELHDGVMRMRGQTDEAVILTERLDALSFLHDVHFLSPVTRVQPSGQELFHIEATITNGEQKG